MNHYNSCNYSGRSVRLHPETGSYISLTLALVTIVMCLAGYNLNAKAEFTAGECPDGGKSWRSLAERRNAHAQFKLGVCYETGTGIQQDHAEAIRWYRRASAQGYQAAM